MDKQDLHEERLLEIVFVDIGSSASAKATAC
jgi:hypothetical protein